MCSDSRLLRSITVGVISLFVIGCCTYPATANFGAQDSFAPPVDPIPYNPALPQFVTFLNNGGLPTTSLTTFDDLNANRHMVATLRHGLRGCFAGATSLTLCFGARALADNPGNDSVVIYDTDLTNGTFQVIHNSSIAPALTPTWTAGTTATLCIDLTLQMTSNQVGDMLQFRVQDDTAVDFITMTLQ